MPEVSKLSADLADALWLCEEVLADQFVDQPG